MKALSLPLPRRKSTLFGAVVIAIFVVMALFAPLLAPYDAHRQVGPVFGSPSGSHPLGLDDGGIDMVSLIVVGSRISLLVGATATLISITIGGLVGVFAGYFAGRTDGVLMRITDYLLAIPVLPLMIVLAAIWGPSLLHVILVIGLLQWTWTARVMRAEVASVRQRAYVKRARAMGAGHARILVHHVLPQVKGLLVVNAVLTIANAILLEAALAFFGVGSPTTISWGVLIADAFNRAAISAGAWWAIVPPGACIALVVLACSLIGTALEDAGNPRMRAPHIFRKPLATVEKP